MFGFNGRGNEKLELFSEVVNQEDYLEKYGTEKKTRAYEQEIEGLFNEVIDEVRKDLDIEKLNTGLRRRVGGVKATSKNTGSSAEKIVVNGR